MTWSAGWVFAEIRVVVQEGVPFDEIGVPLRNRLGEELHAETCTVQTLRRRQRRLSPVIRAQEKSRAMFNTAERPVRRKVFSISRTTGVESLAITAIKPDETHERLTSFRATPAPASCRGSDSISRR